MFKSWQVFVFSLVPLALVFAGVIIGSMHGVDSQKEKFAPPPASSSSSGSSGGAGGSSPSAAPGTLTLTASNLSFDKRSLTALPNTEVKLQFENKDGGVLHNFSLYTVSPIAWVGLVFAGCIAILVAARTRWGWAVAVMVATLAPPRLLTYMLTSLLAGIRRPKPAGEPDPDDISDAAAAFVRASR